MASLVLSFAELVDEVLKFTGEYNNDSPSADALRDAKIIVNRAYTKCINYYDWTFLRQLGTLTTQDGKHKYVLPGNFSYFIKDEFKFDSSTGYLPTQARSVEQIIAFRADNTYESFPQYHALLPGDYYKESGQMWNILFYPTPDTAYKLHYYYKINPDKLINDSDLPIGGVEISECLMELCLAYAEVYKDDKRAVHNEIVDGILGAVKAVDSRRRASHLGGINRYMPSRDYEGSQGNVIVSS